ncbi:apolipoprotein D-like [Asbolus verrucosus]|uniref:Apolipoprotein D-like n=1 Tax=Asbolus verrucosus TaxID=1661398 RepID=A0A482VAG1_ASBVE|nr:apolipoprotein D-like [Asbolus verrucosus]
MKSVYIILAICAITKAQIPNFGFCPDYLPMPDFDMERFLGKWYEAERYFQFSGVVTRCVMTDYAKAPSGKIYVSNEVTNRLTGVKRVIDGNLEVVGKDGAGKLNVKYSTTPIATETSLTVLDTDYDSYAVVWSCNGFGPVHAQSAWVMTRERLAPGSVLQRAYGILDKYKISRTFFVKTDQEGCAIAASDINAANGITATSTVAEATGVEQKQSKWYEAERYFSVFEFGGKCVTADYNYDNNGAVNIINQQISALTGIRSTIEGLGNNIGRSDEAKLSISFPSLPVNFDAPYWVLDTDYDNYSVVWSCSNFGIFSTRKKNVDLSLKCLDFDKVKDSHTENNGKSLRNPRQAFNK